MAERLKFVYAGARFYLESHGEMSALYLDCGGGDLVKSDYNRVERALNEQFSVLIRPATPRELGLFESELKTTRAITRRD